MPSRLVASCFDFTEGISAFEMDLIGISYDIAEGPPSPTVRAQ